ncbi:hypothetical protein GOP47_0027019 [Adiantum capillus-veneris]|nr:hypothetical protein GOP47_0026614 [Adiantum capillus-veneris]KAI5058849.1 hypothetical protein GOP47_0027019 [Adiantum capillus-veneris]
MDQRLWACFLAVCLSFILSRRGAEGVTFTFENYCKYTVWPGLLPNGGSPLLLDGGFELGAGQTRTLDAPVGWSGRFWGRTGCSFSNSASPSAVACESADCGGKLQCSGAGAATPATLAEITLAGTPTTSTKDFYDVSLVDGYNLPIAIAPSVSNPNTSSASSSSQHTSAVASTDSYVCEVAGCIADLNLNCPKELQKLASETASAVNTDGSAVVGCKSACEAFLSPQYCCTGSYANPNTCKATSYSQLFKQACPRAYSYAYDDGSSTYTCTGADYSIIFCPTSLSQINGVGDAPNGSGRRIIISFYWRGFLGLAVLNIVASMFAL